MMNYYLNILTIYSIIGFLLESTIYKIKKSKRYSGICYGPITYVYGFGILAIDLINKYFLRQIKGNKIKKLILTFIICTITLSTIEWLGGTILYAIFKINLWDYSKKSFHLGKYVCLELSLTWGLLGCLYLYLIKKVMDPIIHNISKKTTLFLLIIQLLDISLVFLKKFFKWF